ncbi:MAG: type ISP restriction/modification enzyme, partial [Aggregatilineales bacterium]
AVDLNIFRRGGGVCFPLYVYLDSEVGETAHGLAWEVSARGRYPNLSRAFVAAFAERLGLRFLTEGRGDLLSTFGPEDIFCYSYAILHSPSYRARYAEFLKLDFPRLPPPQDLPTFRRLAEIGGRLVALHLLKQAPSTRPNFPVSGDNRVGRRHPRYAEGRIYLNERQYFEGVSEAVWRFQIGGYQVAEKWLKERRERALNYDELEHYRSVVGVLAETLALMAEIDAIEWR